MNFADMIFHHALTRPEKPAIILADRVVTYGMMAQGILSVEGRLNGLRLQPGSLVAVAIESPIRHLIVTAALFRLGLPSLSARRTRDIPSIGLPIAVFLEGAGDAMIPGLNQILVDEDWFTAPPRRFDAAPSRGFADGDAICRVALSSGTTGQPKASSSGIDAFDRMVLHCYLSIGQGHWDRMLCLPSFTSLWGFRLAAHALFAGKTLCFAASGRDTLNMIALYEIDCLVGSAQHLRDLVEEQRQGPVPCPSLRVIFTGGSLPSPALLNEARASLCATLVVQYGATETGSIAFGTADRLMATEGAVGFIAPWAEVQAVDAEGRVLSPDTDGLLRIRSNSQSRPYPDDGTQPNENFRDGWFSPGDLGRLTEDGMLILAGRRSEIIEAGGTRRAPEAIEDVVRRHPAVTDVAALAGIGDSGAGEAWVAIVASAPFDPGEIIAFCASKGVAIDRIVAVATIPRTALGKIEREGLKPLFAN